MINIGLIGTDGGIKNGHALKILQCISSGNHDAVVTHIYGDVEEERDALANSFNVKCIVKSIEEMLGKVDAVMIVQRDGTLHAKAALPFVKEGYPVFIDKPFTCNVKDAELLVSESKKSGALLFGGSTLKYDKHVNRLKEEIKTTIADGEKMISGYVSYPLYANEKYGGIHFYSHHLIEEMITVFGDSVRSVFAKPYGVRAAAIADYGDFPVYMNFTTEGNGLYVGANFDSKSIMYKQENKDLSKIQIVKFLEGVWGEKHQEPAEYFLNTVKISEAMEKSIASRKEIFINLNDSYMGEII